MKCPECGVMMTRRRGKAMKPLVSVVIPTFNRAAYLKESIESVIAQTYRPLELVIVDDASTDETPKVINDLNHTLAHQDIDLVIIRHKKNRGCGKSLDVGFRIAKGEYISYLGSDDLLIDPDKTTKQVQEMMGEGSDWSYFRDMMVGTSPSDAHKFQPTFLPRLRIFNRVVEHRPRLRLLFLFWRNPINSSSFMVRRIVYLQHGGWQPWTNNADCDGLLLMTYSFLRLKCSILDGAPLFYRVHEGQVSLNRNSMVKGKEATRYHVMQLLKVQNESVIYRTLARMFWWLG